MAHGRHRRKAEAENSQPVFHFVSQSLGYPPTSRNVIQRDRKTIEKFHLIKFARTGRGIQEDEGMKRVERRLHPAENKSYPLME